MGGGLHGRHRAAKSITRCGNTDTSYFESGSGQNMSKIRQELAALSAECEDLCKKVGWVGPNETPNFHLLYSSVETYEAGNRLAILGINPAGSLDDADENDIERPFRGPGYSAYLDDARPYPSQSPLQRAVQAIAMVCSGSTPVDAMAAMNKVHLKPEERIGPDATAMLRNAPSGNIIPFRSRNLKKLCPELRITGPSIGWRMICLARPKPRLIITLANQINGQPWHTILKNSTQPLKADCEKWIYTKRMYREVQLTRGPLKGAILIGLPAVVYDKGKMAVMEPLLNVLAQRLRHHRLLHTSS